MKTPSKRTLLATWFLCWHFMIQAQWSAIGSTNDEVNDFEVYNNTLLMGGRFGTASNIQAKALAFWTEGEGNSKGNWDEFANISGWIYDMIIYQNDLYVSGDFAFINFSPYNKIARFDGTNWSSLGVSGVNGTFTQGSIVGVYSMAVFMGELYAGGTFTAASGVPQTNNIAKWDGSAWSTVGGGIQAQQYSGVRKLYVYGDALYAAGSFSVAGGVPVTNIAKWDGSNWLSVANFGQASFGPASIADFVEYNGDLFAAGNFTLVNGTSVNGIARFDGSTWSNAGSGLYAGANVSSLAVYNNELYASGYFSIGGSSKTNNIAKWTGSTWKSFGPITGGNVNVLSVKQNSLFAGGFFTAIGDSGCVNVARYSPPNLVGVFEQTKEQSHIYPNPFSGETVLDTDFELKNCLLSISDLSGQLLLHSSELEGKQVVIKRGELKAGVYFLKLIKGSGEEISSKLIIID